MARNFPKAPELRRSLQTVSPNVEIIIACEGKVTEPQYFRDCINHFGAGFVRLRVLEDVGVPLTVVKAAVSERRALLEKARKIRKEDGFDPPFRVWAVFDKDEHDVEPAIALAKTEGVDVAFSNPCFEVWALLHFDKEYGSQDGRHDVQRRLSRVMPSYHHENNPVIEFALVKDRVDSAISAAARLCKCREDEGAALGCPATTVGVLVKKVIENGRGARR